MLQHELPLHRPIHAQKWEDLWKKNEDDKQQRQQHQHEPHYPPFIHLHHHHLSSIRQTRDQYYQTNQTSLTTEPPQLLNSSFADSSSFDIFLNWATTDNPDGVSIVHPPSDQGICGSCWAFAATGTVEASAARRAGSRVVEITLDDPNITKQQQQQQKKKKKTTTSPNTNNIRDIDDDNHNDHDYYYFGDDDDQILRSAHDLEQTAIQEATCSVQELIDCDTMVDQGCIGGNPLLAFYFIHAYGLASSQDYPYVAQQSSCQLAKVVDPIVTVHSWGLLTSDWEQNMELVLRYMGPIAVGLNGSDPTFLAYQSGIFSSDICTQSANHAMLIVGYGQETTDDGDIIKYWIARNSWGQGWGENGYVRVLRGTGEQGEPGVCGIARNPSIAIGGVLLSTQEELSSREEDAKLQQSLLSNYCDELGVDDFQHCQHNSRAYLRRYHKTITYFLDRFVFVIVVTLVVLPLVNGSSSSRTRRSVNYDEEESTPTEESRLLADPPS